MLPVSGCPLKYWIADDMVLPATEIVVTMETSAVFNMMLRRDRDSTGRTSMTGPRWLEAEAHIIVFFSDVINADVLFLTGDIAMAGLVRAPSTHKETAMFFRAAAEMVFYGFPLKLRQRLHELMGSGPKFSPQNKFPADVALKRRTNSRRSLLVVPNCAGEVSLQGFGVLRSV